MTDVNPINYMIRIEPDLENFSFSGSDQDADDADDFAIRSQLLLTPLDSLDMTLRFNYAQKRGVGYALREK